MIIASERHSYALRHSSISAGRKLSKGFRLFGLAKGAGFDSNTSLRVSYTSRTDSVPKADPPGTLRSAAFAFFDDEQTPRGMRV